MSDLFEFNGAEGAGWSQPEPSLGEQEAWSTVPEPLRRESPPAWPRASEPELVRHYTWLSSRNFGIDTPASHSSEALTGILHAQRDPSRQRDAHVSTGLARRSGICFGGGIRASCGGG